LAVTKSLDKLPKYNIMVKKKVVAIHQPNFFPWLGFFDRINKSDAFILMDNAQLPKKGSSYTNRVQLIVNRQPSWVRVLVGHDYHGVRLIKDIEISNSKPWQRKLLGTLTTNYSRAPFYSELFPYIEDIVNNPNELLGKYNIFVIRSIMNKLQMDTSKLVLGSEIKPREDWQNTPELLVDMIKMLGGTTYFSGDAAWGYQEVLEKSGIEVVYQKFTSPVYNQCNTSEFVPGLSIIDCLMNIGLQGTRNILSNNISAFRE
jgi:hypothetical protein